MNHYDWNKISNSEKKEINERRPVFVAGSREMSKSRIEQLYSQLAKKGKSILWGILKDEYILGLEGCPQFRTMKYDSTSPQPSPFMEREMLAMEYFQRDLKYILEELDFSAVIFINGSWYGMLHHKPEFWEVVNKKIPYKLVSPFTDEVEAKEYVDKLKPEVDRLVSFGKKTKYTDEEIFKIVDQVAKQSYATDYQIGSVLVKDGKVLLTAYNNVVPYETYAMHNGLLKEKNFSPSQDLNYFDTNHSEVDVVIQAQKKQLKIDNCTLYINVLPCPTCARMLSRTDISEIAYKHDHSDGYAYDLLLKTGKKIRRFS